MIKIKYIGILFLFCLAACEDKEDTLGPFVNPGAGPTLTSPSAGTTYTLVEEDINNIITSFEWTAADFGYQAAINYTLEIDQAGNNFATGITLGSTTDLSLDDVTVGKVNAILLASGLPFGFPNEMEIRVCASVSNLVETLCSDGVALKINPYAAEIVYPKLTVPGDYQDWNPADDNYSVYSRKSDEIYEGYIYFEVETANYKFAQGGTWDVNWGDVGQDGTLDSGGIDNNITTNDGSGMYLIHCDLNTLTHFNQKTDWGLLGDATSTGWDNDTDFEWDADKGALTITADLSVGEIKFRANDSDDINFGDDFNNGTLEAGGANIPITEAGSYTIDLILNVADYTYTITRN